MSVKGAFLQSGQWRLVVMALKSIGWKQTYPIAREIQRQLDEGTSELDTKAVDHALRRVIEYADYDLHKNIECDEETEKDTYSSHVARFVAEYNKAVGNG